MQSRLKHAPLAVKELGKNLLMGFGPIRARRLQGHRTSTFADSAQLYRYGFMLPDLVLKHVGSVIGKDVLEMGPGDHLATGLTFLALGARSYTALDRFPGPYSSPNAKSWYHLVRSNFEQQFKSPWPKSLTLENFPEACPQVRTLPVSIEQLGDCGNFDLVCSLAVGEHVSDVDAFAAANKHLLRPSGCALHYVDFGGHVWERDPKDPLMFRRIPRWLWTAMGSNRGYPNRVPFVEFTSKLKRAGLTVTLASTKPFPHDPAVQEAIYILSPAADN